MSTFKSDRLQLESNIQLGSDKGELQAIKEQIAQLSSDKGELQAIKEQIAQLQKKQNDLLNCLKDISKIILIISIVVIFNNFVLKNKQPKKG